MSLEAAYRFMLALAMLAIWYGIGVPMMEPLFDLVIAQGVSSTLGGTARITTLRKIMFLWAPMVFIVSWFVWSVRRAISPVRRDQVVRR